MLSRVSDTTGYFCLASTCVNNSKKILLSIAVVFFF